MPEPPDSAPRGDGAVDRIAVNTCTSRYVEAVDAGDFDGLLELFAEDGVLHPHGLPRYRGKAEIRAFLTESRRSRSGPSSGRIRHHVSSERIWFPSPGRAKVTSYFIAMGRHGPDHWGVYRDELVATGDRWVFQLRAVTLEGADPSGWIGSGLAPVKFEEENSTPSP